MKEVIEPLRQTFASGQTRDLNWRQQQLRALKTLLVENEETLLAALKQDLGKSPCEAWSAELAYVSGEVDHCLKHLKKWVRNKPVATPLVAQPSKSYLQPEPLGTVLIIGAWNYPLQLVLAPLVPAIAAGNCAVIKPSELAAHSSAALAKLLPHYLDPQAFAVVEGGVEETTALLAEPWDHILYTGNGTVGRIVMSAAAKHLTPVTLELGGKSPCLVDDSADLDISAQRIVWGKFMNAGQTCVAPDYILTTHTMRDKLVAALIKQIEAMYGADAAQSPDYGRIINERHWTRLNGYLQGQNVVYGGQGQQQDRYLAPTLVLNPELDSPLMEEEIFGPILPIITLDNMEDALPLISGRAKPLALYVFSGNSPWQEKVLAQTSAGNAAINDTFMFMANPNLPFGGVGPSGMGNYCGEDGFRTFSHYKAVIKRPFLRDLPLRFAPFTNLKFKLLRLIR